MWHILSISLECWGNLFLFWRNILLQAWCWMTEYSAALVCHVHWKKLLISGFESHLAHTHTHKHKWGWFSSVNNKASGLRLHVSLCWSCFYSHHNTTVLLLRTDHAERQGICRFYHLQQQTAIRNMKLQVLPEIKPRVWASSQWHENLGNPGSVQSGSLLFIQLLWMQTGSQDDTSSNRVALSQLN